MKNNAFKNFISSGMMPEKLKNFLNMVLNRAYSVIQFNNKVMGCIVISKTEINYSVITKLFNMDQSLVSQMFPALFGSNIDIQLVTRKKRVVK